MSSSINYSCKELFINQSSNSNRQMFTFITTTLHGSYGSWHLFICRSLLIFNSRALVSEVLWEGIFNVVESFGCAIANFFLEINGIQRYGFRTFRCRYLHLASHSLTPLSFATYLFCHAQTALLSEYFSFALIRSLRSRMFLFGSVLFTVVEKMSVPRSEELP